VNLKIITTPLTGDVQKLMKPNNKKKQEITPENSRAQYLKVVCSPVYRKKIKTINEAIKDYNRICRSSKMASRDILDVTKYFAEDIRNPITPRNIVKEQPAEDYSKGFLKVS